MTESKNITVINRSGEYLIGSVNKESSLFELNLEVGQAWLGFAGLDPEMNQEGEAGAWLGPGQVGQVGQARAGRQAGQAGRRTGRTQVDLTDGYFQNQI
ncbi:hypothetical protein PPACK8108_LOCUS10200 [Phakopsora pachyrhizi]|uniref:Uncharacterized protein n=1 Tax=Phakopsora pachyrhizi TaxID=170000 RepID=A0AAV0AZW0_PHAPC|nr:hypothetical protein PPACK8108_LOCUS10200 [Phakopsora pachyrhizi]